MTEARRVGMAEVPKLLEEGYQIVDVRTEEEYAAGHPAGAFNVPIVQLVAGARRDNPDFLSAVKALFPPETPLLLSCRSGNRSMRALALLADAGYRDLVDLRPGWGGVRDAAGEVEEPGWSQSELPSETESEGRSYAELRAPA